MPRQAVPAELNAHHQEMVARAVAAATRMSGHPTVVMSDPDVNIQRLVNLVVAEVEPHIAAISLRAFAVGAEKVAMTMPEPARTGAMAVLDAARDVADELDKGARP